jgi:hypothetical protein
VVAIHRNSKRPGVGEIEVWRLAMSVVPEKICGNPLMKAAWFTVRAFAITALLASASEGLARNHDGIDFSAQQKKEKTAPRKVVPGAAPRVIAPQQVAPRFVTSGPVSPKISGAPVVGPRVSAPTFAPGAVTANAHVVTASKLRGVASQGAGSTFIRGQNYSVWRGGYRVPYDGGWATFAGLGALSAIAIGTAYYYPYAYISAPQPYCEGLTEDGCQLLWQEVETIEGDIIPQCVAYCPWQ